MLHSRFVDPGMIGEGKLQATDDPVLKIVHHLREHRIAGKLRDQMMKLEIGIGCSNEVPSGRAASVPVCRNPSVFAAAVIVL